MTKLDPPVSLGDPQNLPRLQYVQDVPEYETNFEPVSY